MYPHGYRVIGACEEHHEPEDEYDNFNEAGEALPRPRRVYDLSRDVDVLAEPAVPVSAIVCPAGAALAAVRAAAAAAAACGSSAGGGGGGSAGGGGGGGGGGAGGGGDGALDDAAPPLLVLPAEPIPRQHSKRKRLRRA